MTSKDNKKHSKHAKLVKPIGGTYHAEEWGIIGAPCSVIQKLAADIQSVFNDEMQIGFLDAAHQSPERETSYTTYYLDNISHQTVSFESRPTQLQYRKYFNELALLIVNGNHFSADKQIVIIDKRKEESLNRKLDRLSNVKLVLVQEDNDKPYNFLAPALNKDVKILNLDNIQGICRFIRSEIYQAALHGLVLAGGKSQRMGEDKSQLKYYDKPHSIYIADLMKPYCSQTFLSKRPGQSEIQPTNYQVLEDTFIGLGPFGAILSAFKSYPNHAWLTLACDLPYIDDQTIQQLIQKRNPGKLATCFHNNETAFPEPLITIWEPRAYPVLLEYLSQGYSCPRKVLINSDIEEIHIENQKVLSNANNKESYLAAVNEISKINQ